MVDDGVNELLIDCEENRTLRAWVVMDPKPPSLRGIPSHVALLRGLEVLGWDWKRGPAGIQSLLSRAMKKVPSIERS